MALPQSTESALVTALISVLETDPTLSGNGVTIRAGVTTRETLPKFKPGPTECPVVQLWVVSCESRRETERTHHCEIDVAATCFMAGHDPRLAMDLWAAVRTALYPADPDRRAAVDALLSIATVDGRSYNGRFKAQADKQMTIGADDAVVACTGVIVLPVDLRTG